MDDKVRRAVRRTKTLLTVAALSGVLAVQGLSAEVISETNSYKMEVRNDFLYGEGYQFHGHNVKFEEGVSCDKKSAMDDMKEYMGYLYETDIGRHLFDNAPENFEISVMPSKGDVMSQTSLSDGVYKVSISEDVLEQKHLIPVLMAKEMQFIQFYELTHVENDISKTDAKTQQNFGYLTEAFCRSTAYETLRELRENDAHHFNGDFSAVGIAPQDADTYAKETYYHAFCSSDLRNLFAQSKVPLDSALTGVVYQSREELKYVPFEKFKGGPDYRKSDLHGVIQGLCDMFPEVQQKDFVDSPHALFKAKMADQGR